MRGTWPNPVREARRKKLISIFVQELLSCAFLIESAHGAGVIKGKSRALMANYNEGAVAVIKSCLSRSALMTTALRGFKHAERCTETKFTAIHISGKDNQISDLLSRGKVASAVTRAHQLFGHATWISTPPSVERLTNQLVTDLRAHATRS